MHRAFLNNMWMPQLQVTILDFVALLEIIMAWKKKNSYSYSTLLAELLTIWNEKQFDLDLRFRNILVKSNYLRVIQMINAIVCLWCQRICDIKNLTKTTTFFSCSYFPPNTKIATHT